MTMATNDNSFFKRLFAGKEVLWALHTTYTCELGYVQSLLAMQYDCETEKAAKYVDNHDTAFFYHSSDTSPGLTGKWVGNGFSRDAAQAMVFPVTGDRTFHAKISLVCYKDASDQTQYRLAVYSKNLQFDDNCAEIALLFELVKREGNNIAEQNAGNLQNYLGFICKHASNEGKKWLENHKLPDSLPKAFALVSEFAGKEAELHFGGCESPSLPKCKALSEYMALTGADAYSMVLTPPEFLRGTAAATYFSQGGAGAGRLYDLDLTKNPGLKNAFGASISSSHIKLYLLKHGEQYTLWTGSANATAHGIGWDFFNQKACPENASVECLVKFTLNKAEFDALRQQIGQYYKCFDDFKNKGSFKPEPDRFGAWVVSHYEVVGLQYYATIRSNNKTPLKSKLIRNNAKYLEIELGAKAASDVVPNKLPFDADKACWYPVEYSDLKEKRGKISKKTTKKIGKRVSNITLRFQFGEDRIKLFKPSQGILIFGEGGYAMPIPAKLLKDIPKEEVKTTKERDTRLSTMLMKDPLPQWRFDPKLKADQKIVQYYNLLASGTKLQPINQQEGTDTAAAANGQVSAGTAISHATLPDKAELSQTPMPFQKKAAERVVELLKKRSRVFLADEAGLGKTYSAAAAVCKLAEAQWIAQSEAAQEPTPFIAIYVAPNRTVLEKCADDFIKKIKKTPLLKFDQQESIEYVDADRLTKAEPEMNQYSGKTIVLLAVSAECALGNAIAREERDAIRQQQGCKTRMDYTRWFLKEYKPGIVIWDEYHRYGTKLKDGKNAFFTWEMKSHESQTPEKRMKALFISATPYPTNVSGEENQKALDDLYAASEKDALEPLPSFESDFAVLFCGGWSENPMPEEHLREQLIAAYLAYMDEPESGTKRAALQTLLKEGMVRNERTRLQGEIERHQRLDPPEALYTSEYEAPLCNTRNQCVALIKAGYPDGALTWSLSLPWVLSFPTDRGKVTREITSINGKRGNCTGSISDLTQDNQQGTIRMKWSGNQFVGKLTSRDGIIGDSFDVDFLGAVCLVEEEDPDELDESKQSGMRFRGESELASFFECLTPTGTTGLPDDLFAYDDAGNPKESLKSLPEQNLPFHEICKYQLAKDDNNASTMAQLLWLPPTVPLYQTNEGSIFARHKDHSKLLVFAEYKYLQRGGALLLSDYAKLLNQRKDHPVPEEFPPQLDTFQMMDGGKLADVLSFHLTEKDHRKQSLDELLENIREEKKWDEVTALAAIASPVAVVYHLEMDGGADSTAAKKAAKEVESAFHEYLRQDGVKEALWAWMVDNGFQQDWKKGLLRYCAEGNLYAVLEEWYAICKIPEQKKNGSIQKKSKSEALCSLLKAGFRTEEGQFFRGTIVHVQTKKTTTNQGTPLNGLPRCCSYADRLTGDVTDVGSGANEENSAMLMQQFTSPFWPMILFAGRGAQEGLDFHQYCMRMMHLTLPRGAVSYEQRRGRIDRYQSLLVRRRAAELLAELPVGRTGSGNLMMRMFTYLKDHPEMHPNYDRTTGALADQLYPNWHIPNKNSRFYFEELIPVWEYTDFGEQLKSYDAMLESYRRPFGTSHTECSEELTLDLSTQ